MKHIALALSLLFLSSCATYGPPVKWPKPNQAEFLQYCWVPGETSPRWPENCPEGTKLEYLQWDHLPLTVSSYPEDTAVLLDTIEVWNKWVGFELFEYKVLEPAADILVLRGGPHLFWRGVAKHFLKDGDLKCGILIFDSAVGDVGTNAHELGHCVGLAHDKDNWHSIMYPNNRRALPGLEKHDRFALRQRYLPLVKQEK